ncbi:hypothetical protein GCM10023329_06330 [Streptomyces sanyensis]|uniref:Integral membrane protein n=2 Tax=Streptomyces TaxID=1883 RepID=A0ABP8ZQN3_9ACTN
MLPGMSGAATHLAPGGPAVPGAVRGGVLRSLAATSAVLGLCWTVPAANTGIAYASLGLDAVPVVTGLIGVLAVVVALRMLHGAWWLALLSLVPGLFVLVGSVQYAPEAALEHRGVHEAVVVTEDSAQGTGSTDHRFTLVGPEGELDETLRHRGSHPGIDVGDRVEVVRDPEGVVPMEEAGDVDPEGRLGGLVTGTGGWTLLTVAAGWRGHFLRRRGRRPVLERFAF